MKLRVKATGEILEIPQDSFVCGVRPNGNDVEFMVQEVEIIPDYWDAFRREAAKDFVAAMLSNATPTAEQWTTPDIVNAAIEIADELIKQLREGGK